MSRSDVVPDPPGRGEFDAIVRERDQLRIDLAVARRARLLIEERLAEFARSAARLHHDIRNPKAGLTQALRAVAEHLGTDQRTVLEDFQARLARIDAAVSEVCGLAPRSRAVTEVDHEDGSGQ